MANLSLNPMATTNALGSFGVQSDGYIQGVALDDPANRFNLAAGTVVATETKPLWAVCQLLSFCPHQLKPTRVIHPSCCVCCRTGRLHRLQSGSQRPDHSAVSGTAVRIRHERFLLPPWL